MWFYFSMLNVSGIAGSHGKYMFNFLKNPPNCFPEWFYYFAFPLAVYQSSSCSTPSSVLDIVTHLWFWKVPDYKLMNISNGTTSQMNIRDQCLYLCFNCFILLIKQGMISLILLLDHKLSGDIQALPGKNVSGLRCTMQILGT